MLSASNAGRGSASGRVSPSNGIREKVDSLRRRRDQIVRRDCEERVTYRTITRTEFQKRRASFESNEEIKYEKSVEVVKGKDGGGLEKKARSMEELTGQEDPYRIQLKEKEMTDKLEDIHRMVKDMQEMTKQLKDRKWEVPERLRSPAKCASLPLSHEVKEDAKSTSPSHLESGFQLRAVPVRYRSTILVAIGSKWQHFKEEVEWRIAPEIGSTRKF